MSLAEGMANLMVDQILPVLGKRCGPIRHGVGPALCVEHDVLSVATREVAIGVEGVAEEVDRVGAGEDDVTTVRWHVSVGAVEVQVAISCPTAFVEEGLVDEAGDLFWVEPSGTSTSTR